MNLEEIKKKLLNKRNILCATAAISAATLLTGCGEKNDDSKDFLLQGTILENCVVTEINNEKTIVKLVEHNVSNNHLHYQEIVGGVSYTDSVSCSYGQIPRIPTPNFENIISYLTKDEIKKAAEGTLTDEDIINIVLRINERFETEDKEASLSRLRNN